ncbi:MAG TPA: class I SAM-dependent methyltransferase [Ilumatobacteraceae bacterium]|nr:class I SAM-dependent methyltransferase [Ilumatobacteraceae bacterium]
MTRRRQHVPWKAAGTASETEHSADDVVRETGWVFNNVTGSELSLAEFVATGDNETVAYLEAFGVLSPDAERQTMVEIGSGIGRMTASFSRLFAKVIACDLDAAFLERCRETVAQFGRPERLQTSHVADGRTLGLPDSSAELVFSYITLQHCHHDDGIALSREAVRVAKPGGCIALNFRTWVPQDVVLWPAGKVVRASWRLPRLGPVIAQRRLPARLGWQANRLTPKEVLATIGSSLDDVRIFRGPTRRGFGLPGTTDRTFEGVHRSHWWVVATVK